MDILNYSLNESYTVPKALLWGNFKGHILAANKACKWQERTVHVLIATAQFFPILSQIASLIEMAVVKIFSSQFEIVPDSHEFKYRGLINPNKEMTAELEEKQKIIDQRQLPLRVNPAIPEKEYPVDFQRAAEWIEACEGGSQIVARKVVDNIQHITFQQLIEELKSCVDRLNTLLQSEGKNYAVGLTIGKSQQWVASLSLEYLNIIPSSYFGLGRQGTVLSASYSGKNNFILESEASNRKIKEDTIVIFDDCSYSGTQLTGNLQNINDTVSSKKTVFLVIPFLSTRATEILELRKFKNLNISVVTSNISLKTLTDIFSLDEIKIIDKMGYANPNQTLCYTDWRFPDSLSTLAGIQKGLCSIAANGETKFVRDAKIKDEVRVKDYVFSFVPKDIPRPYGLEKVDDK